MNPETLRVRSVTFAYLFGPPRTISREQASSVYAGVSDALRLDDLTFRYSTSEVADPNSKGFSILLQRRVGRGIFAVHVEHREPNSPIRLLIEQPWPEALPHAVERADLAAGAVFAALSNPFQKVVAEVRLRVSCNAKGDDALRFLLDRLLRLPPAWTSGKEVPGQASLRVEIDASYPSSVNNLENPKRELMIEVLKEDPRSLYVEYMAQWSQFPPITRPDEQINLDVSRARTIEDKPSKYIMAAYDTLRERLNELSEA